MIRQSLPNSLLKTPLLQLLIWGNDYTLRWCLGWNSVPTLSVLCYEGVVLPFSYSQNLIKSVHEILSQSIRFSKIAPPQKTSKNEFPKAHPLQFLFQRYLQTRPWKNVVMRETRMVSKRILSRKKWMGFIKKRKLLMIRFRWLMQSWGATFPMSVLFKRMFFRRISFKHLRFSGQSKWISSTRKSRLKTLIEFFRETPLQIAHRRNRGMRDLKQIFLSSFRISSVRNRRKRESSRNFRLDSSAHLFFARKRFPPSSQPSRFQKQLKRLKRLRLRKLRITLQKRKNPQIGVRLKVGKLHAIVLPKPKGVSFAWKNGNSIRFRQMLLFRLHATWSKFVLTPASFGLYRKLRAFAVAPSKARSLCQKFSFSSIETNVKRVLRLSKFLHTKMTKNLRKRKIFAPLRKLHHLRLALSGPFPRFPSSPNPRGQTKPHGGTFPIALFRIQRVRFKPGYSRIWRKERTNLRQLWQLKLTYQRSLTRYLTHFKPLSTRVTSIFLIMRLEFILRGSSFFTNTRLIFSVIEAGWVFVNGIVNLNRQYVLYVGDVLQLPVSIRYYSDYVLILNRQNLFSVRNRIHRNKFHARHGKKFNFRRSFVMYHDAFNFLEVDFLSMSCFVLFGPRTSLNRALPIRYDNQLEIANMYNWKYIT